MTLAGTVQFTIGAGASCSDGTCGEVTRVIVDPVAEAVTHLVVEPEHRRGLGRLVPLGLIDAAAGQVRLRCTQAEFEKLEPADYPLDNVFFSQNADDPAHGRMPSHEQSR